MLGGHGQNYFADALAFGLAIIPVAFLLAVVTASLLEAQYRAGRTPLRRAVAGRNALRRHSPRGYD